MGPGKHIFNLLGFFFFFLPAAFAQHKNLDLSRDILRIYEPSLYSPASSFHTSVKPYLSSEIPAGSVPHFTGLLKKNPGFSDQKKHALRIKPYVFLNPSFGSGSSLETTLGPVIEGMMGKLSFAGRFLAGRGNFVKSMDSLIRQSRIIPGMGYAYGNEKEYSFQNYAAYLSLLPNEIFNIQAGIDKHFFGDGYRSLFLSDVSNSYPFLKAAASFWKVKYVNLWASLRDVSDPSGLKQNFSNKYAAFHYLSWNISKRFNLNFFESVIWQGSDSIRNRGYDVNYLNPVLFFRPVEYSLGSSDNSLMGLGFSWKLLEKQVFYGQLMLDEFLLKEVLADVKERIRKGGGINHGWWANKQAMQIGFKSFDLFRLPGLNFQTEFNAAKPYTYSHGSPLQSYGHYNQPLAHPLGANFMENVSFLSYRKNNIVIEGKLVAVVYGADSSGLSYGQDIFKSYVSRVSDYGNKIAQGLRTNLFIGELRCSYMLFPRSNMLAEIGISRYLKTNSIQETASMLFFAGIKTSVVNLYNDF